MRWLERTFPHTIRFDTLRRWGAGDLILSAGYKAVKQTTTY